MPPRQHPLLSPVAIVSTVLLLLALGAALYFTGGRAFSPGKLSAVSHSGLASGGFESHAAFADDCTTCHVPFGGVSAEKCTDCHTTIADHRARQIGLHGRLADAACTSCHTEHNGATNDLFATALDQFSTDHHAMLFVLDGAHAERECIDCHADAHYVETPADCIGCHAEPELHAGLFGVACADCHTTSAWHPARLATHSFPLDHGGEGQIACATCHVTSMVTFTCAECHSPVEMVDEHDELGLTSAELNACTTCHVTGTEAEKERLEQEYEHSD
jgi:predicted CXXCH cytochrome family protein